MSLVDNDTKKLTELINSTSELLNHLVIAQRMSAESKHTKKPESDATKSDSQKEEARKQAIREKALLNMFQTKIDREKEESDTKREEHCLEDVVTVVNPPSDDLDFTITNDDGNTYSKEDVDELKKVNISVNDISGHVHLLDQSDYANLLLNPIYKNSELLIKRLASRKFLIKPSLRVVKSVTNLYKTCPNFETVIDEVLVYVRAQNILDSHIELPNMLLNGAPGVGKSHFIKQLAHALNLPHRLISMAGSLDNLRFTGLSTSWGNAQPSDIVKFLANFPVANPIILLDEVEKANNEKHNVESTLLSLLERQTARNFDDAYLQLASGFNCSNINYFATSNTTTEMSQPLLSRFQLFEVNPLTQDQVKTIIYNMYKDIMFKIKGFDSLKASIPDSVLDYASDGKYNMRELHRVLNQAVHKAVIRIGKGKRTELHIEDFEFREPVKKSNGIGFHATFE